MVAAGAPILAENTAQRTPHSRRSAAQVFEQEDLLWWLPTDTESVVAAHGLFPMPIHRNEDKEEDERWFTKEASQAEINVQFEQLPLELLIASGIDKRLRGSNVLYAMQGSRHFRDPLPGLEVMDFEGCSIVVFESDLSDNLMRKLATKATRRENVVGTTVLVLHDKLEQAEWNYFVALPRPNVLLVANDLPYLQEVLERIAARKIGRALPSDLPEWRFLDPSVRFWGLRHYDRTRGEEDPTSPFSEERTFGPRDQKALGVLFLLEPSDQKQAVMTYFSGDEAVIRKLMSKGTSCEEAVIASTHEVTTKDGGISCETEEPQAGVRYEVKLRSPAPGVIERIYPLDRSSALDYFILAEEIGLGRGMYF
jgi:hypothetical protein